MNIDVGKLITLIKDRELIYDNNSKDQSKKLIIEKLWQEIAEEMECSVSECKTKWTSLRNSFSRHIRQETGLPPSKKRKIWYLANEMSFLKNCLKSHKILKSTDAIDAIDAILTSADNSNETFEHISSPGVCENNSNTSFPDEGNVLKNSISSGISSAKIEKTDFASVTNFEYLNTLDKEDDADLLFFKSILADFKGLSKKRKRHFKQSMLTTMIKLQDDDENDIDGLNAKR